MVGPHDLELVPRFNSKNSLRKWGIRTLGVLALVGGLATLSYSEEPRCDGRQSFVIKKGEDPRDIAHAHIRVEKGDYLDINSLVETGLQGNHIGPLRVFYDNDARISFTNGPLHKNPNVTGQQPGDTVTMPETCSVGF